MSQAPDLYVVCKTCGNEVSPFITECPYCGTRLRKRAPKIERDGTVVERKARSLRARRAPRLSRLRAGEIPGVREDIARRAWATGILVALSLLGYLLLFVVDSADIGVVGALDDEWWRTATSPFLYANVWYEVAAVGAIAVFGWLLERRYGPLVVLVLFALCGIGGAAVEVLAADSPVALGGNGAALGMLAAWAAADLRRRLRGEAYEGDLLGVAVWAAVLLLMPVARPEVSAIAGVVGGVVGLMAGMLLTRPRGARA